VLIDERTFKLVKHSLSALGAVDENGFNDKQLQQRLHALAAVHMQMACAVRCWRYVVTITSLLDGAHASNVLSVLLDAALWMRTISPRGRVSLTG
jgi:hypothetical protein